MKQPDRLFNLLPAVYRQRDAAQGNQLRALLRVVEEQVEVVEDDILQLGRNWFIETCEDWVVPYIGDLIGYRPIHDAGEPGDPRQAEAGARNRILIPRREVANTLRYRRRKGTLALLEQLAHDVAGWPARAVEFRRLLGWSQHLNHQRPARSGTADLRRVDALERLDGPFDTLAHSVDLRRVNSAHTPGRANLPDVGVFVWRLRSHPVTHAPAYCLDADRHCYRFSILGHDTPLFIQPRPEADPTAIAEEANVPARLQRRALEQKGDDGAIRASTEFYGPDRSLAVWAPDWPKKGAPQPIPADLVIPADLSGWHYRVPAGRVAVDPQTGRMAFPRRQTPPAGVWVSYNYGFSAELGGGEYERPLTQPAQARLYRVGQNQDHPTIADALARWEADKHVLLADAEGDRPTLAAVIEITESSAYTEMLRIELAERESLQIRAASGTRPVLRLLDYQASRADALRISGEKGSRFTLDGLLVAGRGLLITGPQDPEAGDLCDVTIRHCTLVPGWQLHETGTPRNPEEPSIEIEDSRARLRIEHSIVGAIRIVSDEVKTDPVRIELSDSILDGTGPETTALGGEDGRIAPAVLALTRCTVFGQVQTHQIELATNCLFMGTVWVARRQPGCMRFCHVPAGSRTPRRHRCQPDLAVTAAAAKLAAETPAGAAPGTAELATVTAAAQLRVRPQFNSTRYGTPAYAQLAAACAEEIRRGADDESEMGAFHDLFLPQREANLQARLDEFTPAGCNAGIIFAT